MSSLADLAWLGHPGPGCLACFTPGDAVSSQTGVPTQPGAPLDAERAAYLGIKVTIKAASR